MQLWPTATLQMLTTIRYGLSPFQKRVNRRPSVLRSRMSALARSSSKASWRSSLRSEHPDTSQLPLLNEFNEPDVGSVEGIMSDRSSGRSSFLTKPLIHRQALLQYG